MDDVRAGRILQMLRLRRGWTQARLADRVRLSQQTISLIERGHGSTLACRRLRQVFGALDARWEPSVTWRGGALDRLLDEAHGQLEAAAAGRLRDLGWTIEVEVTYSTFGERGSIDLLAAKPSLSAVVSVEVKTEITTLEATLRKLDEKDRLVRRLICRERFGFAPSSVGRVPVLPDSSTSRRRLRSNAVVLDAALPARGAKLRRWLADPIGDLSGIWVVANTSPGGARATNGRSARVRRTTTRGEPA